jgi:hypothetical protein
VRNLLDGQRAERLKTSQLGEKGTPTQAIHMPMAPAARWCASVRVGSVMAWCLVQCMSKRSASYAVEKFVSTENREAQCSPHTKGGPIACILLQLFRSHPCPDGTRGVSTKFRDGLSTPLPQTLLLPPTCRMLLTLPSVHGIFAWQASASGSLRSQICTLSLSLRGRPASWRRLS